MKRFDPPLWSTKFARATTLPTMTTTTTVRMLGGGKKLGKRVEKASPGDWFDIATTYETSCKFCGNDDDKRFLAKSDSERVPACV
jgi:hypothetical protein